MQDRLNEGHLVLSCGRHQLGQLGGVSQLGSGQLALELVGAAPGGGSGRQGRRQGGSRQGGSCCGRRWQLDGGGSDRFDSHHHIIEH